MAQITGIQTGTPQDDNILNNVELRFLDQDTAEASVINSTINTLNGDDRLEATTALTAGRPNLSLEAIGISQSRIDGGVGNDLLTGEATSSGNRIGLDNIFSGTVRGVGLVRSSVRGGDSSDNLQFNGTGREGTNITGIGLSSSSAEGGNGDDTISIMGNAEQVSTLEQSTGTATGSENGVVTGGNGQDTIEIVAEVNASNSSSLDTDGTGIAIAARDSFINGDGGEDLIELKAAGFGSTRTELSAASSSEVRGGGGNDILRLTTDTNLDLANNIATDTAENAAVKENSLVSADAGDDAILINSKAISSTEASIFGVKDSTVKGGDGKDRIEISSRLDSASGNAFGVSGVDIDGGNDNDSIFIRADIDGMASGASATQSTISGGAGDDIISFSVGGTRSGRTPEATALRNSKVYGNSGNDSISTSTSQIGASYDIIDSHLFGGAGDDLFNVGIGNGKIVGGAGNDSAFLDYLNGASTTAAAIPNGVRISGTQTKTGEDGPWTQDILGVETYFVNGLAYTNDSLVGLFGGA